MVPKTHRLSLLTRKIYNALLYLSQKQLQNMGGLPLANHLFEAKLTDILDLCDSQSQSTRAKFYLLEMQKYVVQWKSPDTNSELKEISFALLSEARILQKQRAVTIQWGLPPSLYDALIDPKRWASIDISILSKLSSYTSVALYEICSRYRSNHNGLTNRNNPEWWADALSASVSSTANETGLSKKREWRKIKSELVQDSITEINEKTDIFIELIEHKVARGVVSEVQFRVRRKNELNANINNDILPEASSEITMYADRLGITNKRAINAMANAYGNEDLFSSLKKLEHRQSQVNLPEVASPESYLNKLISNQKPQEPIQTNDDKFKADCQVATSESADALPKSWITIKREKIFSEIISLSMPDQRKWVNKCVAQLKESGSFTSAIQRRAKSNNWDAGMLKYSVIDLYAYETYGPDWNKPESSESMGGEI